jgi:hypothetical protein
MARTPKRTHPESPDLRFSRETIYQAIDAMPRGEQRAEVVALLRFGHTKRRPRIRGKDRRSQIPHMLNIHERPAEITERLVPGHWEGNTLQGRYHRSAVVTLVERKTLFVTLARMDGTGAEAALQGFCSVLARIDTQHHLSGPTTRERDDTPSGAQAEDRRPGSLTRTAHGSAASTKTPTACSANTSPSAKTSASTPTTTSTPSPGRSTRDQESHSAGNAQQESS